MHTQVSKIYPIEFSIFLNSMTLLFLDIEVSTGLSSLNFVLNRLQSSAL